VEPTPHADPASGRIPPQAAAAAPDQAAAQAAAFRRNLDQQSTSNDETMVLPPVPGGPADPPAAPRTPPPVNPALRAPAGPTPNVPATYIPSVPVRPAPVVPTPAVPVPTTRNVRLIDAQNRGWRRPEPGGGGGPEPAQGHAELLSNLPVAGPAQPAQPIQAQYDQEPTASPTRHSAGNRPGRLPAAIGVCAVLAMVGGLILVLTTGGLSTDPTAPVALPPGEIATQQIVIAGGTKPGSVGVGASPTAGPTTTAPHSAVPVRQTTPAVSATTVAATTVPPSSAPAGPTAAPSTSTFKSISAGSSGQQVSQLQSRLQQWGYMVKSGSRGYGSECESSGWDPSGNDETQTTDAVYQFQRNYDDLMGGNLQTNGICDYATWQALFNNPVSIKDCYGNV
jgi:Putative peptidoglycan binding domain